MVGGRAGRALIAAARDLVPLAGRVDAGKLGFAVQLAFWRQHGRFPEEADVHPPWSRILPPRSG
jgi:hypothetical protein